MIEIYKIVSGKYDHQASNFIKLRKDHVQRDQGRGNSRKLLVQRPKLNIRKYSFSVRTANIWNSLPEEVVCAKSLNSFKNRLDKFWNTQEVLYDYKADISTETGSHSRSKFQLNLESDEEDLTGPVLENHHK